MYTYIYICISVRMRVHVCVRICRTVERISSGAIVIIPVSFYAMTLPACIKIRAFHVSHFFPTRNIFFFFKDLCTPFPSLGLL